jgi:hypothetical protein
VKVGLRDHRLGLATRGAAPAAVTSRFAAGFATPHDFVFATANLSRCGLDTATAEPGATSPYRLFTAARDKRHERLVCVDHRVFLRRAERNPLFGRVREGNRCATRSKEW